MNRKNTLIILDDAQSITLSQRGTGQFATEQPFLFQLNILGRYAGMKILEVSQGVSQVKDFIKQNSALILAKGLHSIDECYEAGKLLNLTENEQKEALLKLKIDEAFFIDKNRSPVGVKIKTFDFPDFNLTIEEINILQKEQMDGILSHVVRNNNLNNVGTAKEEELSYHLQILMQDLKRFPFDFQKEREARLNLNSIIISNTLESLVDKGQLYRYENKISLGKGKGQFQPYVFTEKSLGEFGKQEIKGKGSIEHAFWQTRCAKAFSKKGYDVEIEYFLSKENSVDKERSLHSIDVVARNDSEKIAIEIELNDTPHILDNVLKCINGEFDSVIFAVYGAKLMKRIQSMILANAKTEKFSREGKIKIEMLSSFLEE